MSAFGCNTTYIFALLKDLASNVSKMSEYPHLPNAYELVARYQTTDSCQRLQKIAFTLFFVW